MLYPAPPQLANCPPEIHSTIADIPLLETRDAVNMYKALVKEANSPKLSAMRRDMEEFRDFLQNPSKDGLDTFNRLIDRLNRADRRLKGIPAAVSFEDIKAIVHNAVTAAYDETFVYDKASSGFYTMFVVNDDKTNIAQRNLCITVLKAVFSLACFVSIKPIDVGIVDVLMHADPIKKGKKKEGSPPPKGARLRFKYSHFNGKEQFDALEVYTNLTGNAYSIRLLWYAKFGLPPLFECDTLMQNATVSQLLEWPCTGRSPPVLAQLPSTSVRLEETTNGHTVIDALSCLIEQSGIFSDLNGLTTCRATFTNVAL